MSPSGGYLPKELQDHLRHALDRRGLVDEARQASESLRSAALWLGLGAFLTKLAADLVDSIVNDAGASPAT